MAATGHTPFYRRPTIEKDVHKVDIKELTVHVVQRRLITIPEEPLEPHDKIVYHRPERLSMVTQTCTCSCHHIFQPREPEDEIERGRPISDKPSVLYQPDPSFSKLDAWDARFGLESPELQADGWMCIDAAGSPEVLLYIHGYNNSHVEVRSITGTITTVAGSIVD